MQLYNNQINANTLIGQSAMGYCAGKPTEKSRVFWIIIIKKPIDHKFLWVMGWLTTWEVGRTLEEFVKHSPVARGLRILLVFYQHPTWFISQ